MANRRVVLDTNILASAILFGGKSRLILDDVIESSQPEKPYSKWPEDDNS